MPKTFYIFITKKIIYYMKSVSNVHRKCTIGTQITHEGYNNQAYWKK